jgi:Chitobiase/beta-hexosaminidase C-terminal domain/Right handed beta helix region/Bacterial Ig-like domain (group 2)
MRIPPKSQACSGLLCGLLVLLAGCGSPSSQTLDSLTVTATPSTLSVGGAATLRAVAHLSDGTTQDVTAGTQWTLSNPALATMSSSALTAKAAGTLTVQAAYVETTPAGTSPASAAVTPQSLSASTQIIITAAGTSSVPTVTWNAPAAITYGTALSTTQLSATANIPGTFAYTPAAGTVLSAGKQTLSVIFTPTDTTTSSSATASVALTVNQATPVITWAQPAPVAAGATLSATQLDATANVPGSFMYSPAAGTVPAAGTQQLTAVFSPTDATDYASVTAHTSLVVNGTSSGPGGGPTGPGGGPIGPAPTGCGGPTIDLNSGMSESTLQSTISSAPTCALIVFAAGTYTISSPVNIPCSSKLTLTGPAAWPTTAILNATFTKHDIFTLSGCSGITIDYLHFQNTGGIYITTPAAGITIEHDQFSNLPGDETQGSDSGVYIQGSGQNTLSNTVISWNAFGSPNDCNGVMTQLTDQGGLCNGIMWQSTANGLTMENNTFLHLENGIKLVCIGSCGPPSSITENNITIKNNDFQQIHRIGIEMQPQPSSNVAIQYNSFSNNTNGYWSSMGWSHPCCDTGATAPAVMDTDNVLIANNPPVTPPANEYIPFAIEFWGNGAQGDRNLIQGYWANGITWGYGAGSWEIKDNTICGPAMAKNNWYISNEEHQSNPPTQSGNTMSPTCQAMPSTAPTISPAAGAISAATTVTLSDSGINHSIYYTTDGSTPTTSSTLYTGPFPVNPGTTVQAIGMWGQGANAKSYPAGYGYVPSAVVSTAYTASVAPPPVSKVSSAIGAGEASSSVSRQAVPPGNNPVAAILLSVSISPSRPVVAIGSTTQLKALATFNDGSVKDVTSDFGWQSSDQRTITTSASGTLAGLATGPALILGSYHGVQASVSATSSIGQVDWSGPIVITEGGTYSGNWQSTDAKTPAVTVKTTAPVVIENSHIRSLGSLIKTTIADTDLTVRNSLGVALNSSVKGQPNGVFLEVSSPTKLDVENNYIESVQGGVIVHGYSGNRDGEQTIVIRSNRARNLNGLLSDGHGGYLPGEGANRSAARFIQFDSVQSVPGIDVGWNEVINYPGRSLVEDNIDVFRSGGTPNRPLEIHDTYIQGAYPYRAAQDAYAGGGIKTDARAGDSAQVVPAFNSIHDNQVVGTVNYGIEFAAGHDNVAANNRVVSSGLLADGTRIAAQHVGMANGDARGSAVAAGSMYNNIMRDNLIGWMCWSASCAAVGYRKDQYFPASPADYSTNSVLATGQITLEMENNEYQRWVNKAAAARVEVGPSF